MKCARNAATTVAGLFVFLGTGVASAADPIGEIINLQGSVIVNSGDVFLPASVGMQLAENDRLLVLEAGSATLAMRAGCTYQASENAIVELTSEGLCAQSEAAPDMETIERAAVGQFDERQAVLGAVMETGGSSGTVAASTAGLATFGGLAFGGFVWAIADYNDNDRAPLLVPLSP